MATEPAENFEGRLFVTLGSSLVVVALLVWALMRASALPQRPATELPRVLDEPTISR